MLDNKKGIGIDDAVPSIIFIFVVTIAILFLRINEAEASDKNTEEIKKQKYVSDAHSVLMGYLTKLDENGDSRADFISKSYAKKDYKELKKDMEHYFSGKLAYLSGWHINLIDQSKNNILSLETDNFLPKPYDFVRVAPMFIPVNGKTPQYLALELFLDSGPS